MRVYHAPDARKRALFWGLCVAGAVVWGSVFYLAAAGLGSGDASSGTNERASADVPPGPVPSQPVESPAYTADFRDPFVWPERIRSPPATVRPRNVSASPERPPWGVAGIIGETVLLRDDAGATHVVRVGEPVGNGRILQVHAEHVRVRFRGRTFTLALPGALSSPSRGGDP